MIIEMVAPEIEEGAGAEPDAVETMLVEPVRGRFHREMGDALAGQLVERGVQRKRVRRRQRAVIGALARHDTDRTDTRRFMAERLEYLAGEIRHR
jgi:hypothetical protein